nr:RIP metalloprotease RseP [Sphingomonas quercus]
MTVLSFLLVIGPLIFIHEMGHYLAGRACGVKADVFSIGFGRELFGWTDRRGTRWKVGWMPIGGYVKFAGDMNPASTPTTEWLALPAAERARTFQAKSVWQRFLIVLAGPATNFLFAILVFCAVFATLGEPTTPPVIAGVQPGSPAAAAGLRAGDRITSVSGRAIGRFEQIQDIVQIRPGERMTLAVERDGRTMSLPIVTGSQLLRDRFGNEMRIGRLGILAGRGEMRKLGPTEVVGASLRYTVNAVGMMIETTAQIIRGQRAASEMGGPLKIAQVSGQQASMGWFEFIWFMTMISINLGFINLLPVPLLDGGHLFFYAIEAVRRRPLEPRVQEWAFRSGLAMLLSLMLFVTFNDLGSFGLWRTLAGLIG